MVKIVLSDLSVPLVGTRKLKCISVKEVLLFMRDSEFDELVKYTTGETRSIEFKSSMSWNDEAAKLKITKSVLALSNIKNGGLLILGVQQEGNKLNWVGMEAEHAKSYNYDLVSSHVAPYADPYVQFSLTPVTHDNANFIVMSVNEFNQVPVLCKKDYIVDGRVQLKGVNSTQGHEECRNPLK